MPKLFKAYFISFLCLVGANTHARDVLCPAPPAETQSTEQEQASAEQLQHAMQVAKQSALQSMDWVEAKDLNHCHGYYQAPDNPNVEKHQNADTAQTFLSADSLQQDELGRLILQGDVSIYQGPRRISCDKIILDNEQGINLLDGNIHIREPGLLFTADQATINNRDQRSELSNARYLLHEQQARGYSKQISIDNSDNNLAIVLNQSSFSLCPENNETWLFQAKSIELDRNKGWGTLRSATFKVYKVPVAYIPYLNFPIDDRRKTGVLWPAISGGKSYIDVALPIYFNLAPNYDMTYTPRVLSTNGYLHNLEGRYKQRYSDWQILGSYIDADKRVNGEKTKKNDELDKQRWLTGFKQDGQFGAHWTSYIDYTAVSDIHYFRDWGTTGLDVQKSLNIKRHAGFAYQDSNWLFSTQVVDYDNLEYDPLTQKQRTEEYRLWPEFNLNFRNKQRHLQFEPLLEANFVYYDHDSYLTGSRLYSAPGVSLPMRWQALEITPSAKVKNTHFFLRSGNNVAQIHDLQGVYQGSHSEYVPTFSLDAKLYFERNQGNSSSILTPRLFYYYAHYRDQSHLPNFATKLMDFSYQQLWREGRMSGYDRIDDANQLSLGLENTWYINGQAVFDMGIGQTLFFQDRKVSPFISDQTLQTITGAESHAGLKRKKQLNRQVDKTYYRDYSDIALQSNWYPSPSQQVRNDLIFDPTTNRFSEASVGYHFNNQEKSIANISYRYQFQPQILDSNGRSFQRSIQQLDGSFYLPVSTEWDLYASAQYDITNSELIENITGARYESCCWSVMFAYKRERKTFSGNSRVDETTKTIYRNYWFIQFELKGLGGISDIISRLLKERIQGFN